MIHSGVRRRCRGCDKDRLIGFRCKGLCVRCARKLEMLGRMFDSLELGPWTVTEQIADVEVVWETNAFPMRRKGPVDVGQN